MDKYKQGLNSGNTKSRYSVAYKVILAFLILTAILHRAGLFGTQLQLHTLYSFTTISNGYIFIVTLITLYTAIYSSKYTGSTLSQFRGIGVVMIVITGLVYHFILLPQKVEENPSYTVFTYGNIIAHYIAPAGMFFDWLLFDKKGKIHKLFPVICSSIPLLYFIVFSIYGYYGPTIPNKETSYVYFFMDFGNLGFVGVMKWVLPIFLLILLLSCFVYYLDYMIAKKSRV